MEAGYDNDMQQTLMNKIIFLLSLSLSSLAVQAAGYHVEVIIFENLQPATDGEISQTAMNYPDYSGAINLDDEADNPFRLLSSGLYKLGGVYNQLKASGKYRPFLHVAWQQPALYGDSSRSVHILKTEPGTTGNSDDSLVRIEGTIRVRASQFLHADVDMIYFPQAAPESVIHPAVTSTSPVTVQLGYSRLRESRRMKLNELHYFDHPLFGIIMHISRAE
jgi:hypothetical protein